MRPALFLALIAIFATGCAPRGATWIHSSGSGTQAEFNEDKANCMAKSESVQSEQINVAESDSDAVDVGSSFAEGYNIGSAMNAKKRRRAIFDACMKGKGYFKDGDWGPE